MIRFIGEHEANLGKTNLDFFYQDLLPKSVEVAKELVATLRLQDDYGNPVTIVQLLGNEVILYEEENVIKVSKKEFDDMMDSVSYH